MSKKSTSKKVAKIGHSLGAPIHTREQWLKEATRLLTPLIEKCSTQDLVYKKRPKKGSKGKATEIKVKTTVPEKIQVGCGWPKGGKRDVIGQCFDKDWTKDGTISLYVSPVLKDPVMVLATQLHELVHATVGCECGHQGPFKKLATALGLKGKMTATFCEEGTDLHRDLTLIAEQLGAYPHSAMVGRPKPKKPGGGGWVRLRSTTKGLEKYKVMVSPVQLEEHGAPLDPAGKKMVPLKDRGGDDEEDGDDE